MTVFPLPPLSSVRGATLSATAFRYVSECIDSLNWMQGCGHRPAAKAHRGSEAKEDNLHAESHLALLQAGERWSLAGEAPSQQDAWNSMMKGRGDYAATAHSSMATYEPSRLSVPESVADGPGLAALLPVLEKERLAGFKKMMLRSPGEVALLEKEFGPPGRHTDPKLGHRRTYLRFISQMHQIGLVKFVTRCKEKVGVFFVWKKGREKMRLILDCRAANRHFVLPPSTELLSSEGFARIEAELDGGPGLEALRMHLGIADVKDCFHRMKLEGEICEYFCYEGGYASEFGVSKVDGEAVPGSAWIYPAAAVLPMGWAWSLHFAQAANVHAFSSVDFFE